MPEPISDRRWNELHRLAWSPEFRPPEGTPDRVRHDALRDAVNEVKRLRGLAHSNMPCGQRLAEILAEHRVMMRVGEQGQLPKLLTDLLQWNAITVEGETHYLREELDHIRTELDARRTHHPDRSTRTEEAMSETDSAPPTGCSYPDTFAGRLRALVDAWRNRVPDNGIIAEGPDYGAPYLLWSDLDAALTENVQLERALDNLRFELDARIAAESADAAAGSYAGRAEAAEATVARWACSARLLAVGELMGKNAFEVIATLTEERGAATARAEQAEAALAEMRERLGEPGTEWAVRYPADEDNDELIDIVMDEGEARDDVAEDPDAALLCRLVGEWRDVTPRTVLERAADEQGNGGN